MTRIRTGDVKIDGLKELNAALKEIGPDARKELKEASKTVATFVANDAKAAALTIGGVAAHVAPSIKPVASVTGTARDSKGGKGYEMAGGAEFGAYRDKKRTRRGRTWIGYRQFKPWRGAGESAGYFLYPAIRQDADRIVTEYTAALDDIIRKRFPQ